MIALPVAELQGLGRLETTAEEVTGVQIDSRRIEPGDLFVAVRGGVDFVDQARERGAAATLIPDDDFAAMAAIGRAVRGSHPGRGGRDHRLHRQNVDKGRSGGVLPPSPHDGRRRGELQRRARRPAHARASRAGDADPDRGAGDEGLRPDRRSLRDRPTDPRCDHRHRPRAPRVRRICRRGRKGEGRAARRPSPGSHRGRACGRGRARTSFCGPI